MAGILKNTFNYLTQQNGCIVVDASSEREAGSAANILIPDQKSLWVTTGKLPQQCTISLKKIIKKPPCFSAIGFYCWHQYDSNPALIEVWARGGTAQSDKWQLISKIRLSFLDTWQYFKIQELPADKVKQIKLKIVENFGGSGAYLNKVGLFHSQVSLSKESVRGQIPHQQSSQIPSLHPSNLLHPSASSKQPVRPPQRQKTYSEHQPAAGSSSIIAQLQKEVRKANDSIAYLSEEQEKMKKTILHQQKTIIKMQSILDSVVTNFNKWQKLQDVSIGANKHNRDHSDENEDYYDDDRGGRKQAKKSNRNQQSNRNEIEQLKSMINEFQKNTAPKPSNFKKTQSNKNSISSHKFSTNYPDGNNRLDIIKANTNSEDELSEYTQTQANAQYRTSQAQYQYGNGNRSNGKYNSSGKEKEMEKGEQARMLEKLHKLLKLREEKKKELRKSAVKRSQAKRESLYDYDDHDDDNGGDHDYQE